MGHYASEMCGNTSTETVSNDHMWLVDGRTLEVMRVADFDKKYEYLQSSNGMLWPGNPEIMRCGSTLFATAEEASAHRIVVLDAQIKRHQNVIHEANVCIQQLLMKKEMLDENN